ncbi:peptidase [Brumimicrobium oceani]|uniref:Peptidase n=1 Tax=Brumimicrobium oceani TaxID=2100725 RepID=A0A2U2XHG3_9FLAO|nr:peptidase [Brumimicrobium oceani]
MKKEKPIIGKDDIADFPIFNLLNVNVKIDSGAYTSTIHCSEIEEVNKMLRVVFLDENESAYTGESLYFLEFDQKKVRSSSGEMQVRYIVQGNIILFGKKHTTEFTLSNRELMRYPVLLGRKLLSNRFVIDTTLSNESYKKKK